MGTWNSVRFKIFGEKMDINAFNRIALKLPILRHYVIKRNGKAVDEVMFEDMIFEKPTRWAKSWCSQYFFTLQENAPIEMVKDVSKTFPQLCFQMDWNWENEEFGSFFVSNGRSVKSRYFFLNKRRGRMFKKMAAKVEEDDEIEVIYEIDFLLSDEFEMRFEKLWRPRILGHLAKQRQASKKKKPLKSRQSVRPAKR